jgi:hypothetical protein
LKHLNLNATEPRDDLVIDVRLGGHDYWYVGGGRWLPQISGGDGPSDPPEDGDDPGDNDEGDDDKKFTQADLDKHAAREKKQGKRAAVRELLEKFNFESVEEVEAFLKEAREKAKPAKRPKEREAGDKDVDDKSADKVKERERRVAAKELDADIRIELISAGAPRDRDKLATLSRMIDRDELGDDPDQDDIADAVEDLKKDWPALFESNDDGDDRSDLSPDSSAAPEGGRRRRPGKKSGFDKANDRFERNHGKSQSQ